jgi:lipid A ethanolaminephosphotransferase
MLKAIQKRPTLGANALLLLVVAYVVVALNTRFWGIVFDSPGLAGLRGFGVIAAIAAALFALTLLMVLPLSLRWTFKPGLTLVLILAAGAAYFIGDYGAVIDRHALASVYETDAREAGEWLNLRMLLSIGALGVLPAIFVWWTQVDWQKPVRELFSRLKLALLAFALLGVAALGFGKDVASLLRNHMELRHIANPFALLAANLSYLDHARNDNRPLKKIGLDARRGDAMRSSERPLVLVLAIGESMRAASLDLNGYGRDTDFDLHPLPAVNFGKVSSCGTNTATSLPCMFSDLGRRGYDDATAKHRENVLDVLMRGGYDVLWLDNNTGSKGIAARAREVRMDGRDNPALCNAEGCYDQTLVETLRETLPTIRRDTVIVVYLLGSHGPAYYSRYPQEFKVFQPECLTNELQSCSDAQLRNTYDNTVLYSTHVLAEIASLLGEKRALINRYTPGEMKCHVLRAHGTRGTVQDCPAPLAPPAHTAGADAGFDAAMLFVSDHGESLGEHGLYLHGAPYAIAPDEQTHVPMLFWTSDRFGARRGIDLTCVRSRADTPLSHDNFFHSVLGLTDVDTAVHKPELDVFATCTGNPSPGISATTTAG